MKILNLRFKNINSLSGENAIDFTRPEFTNNGIFAITGKTGAGKSSILDAISLALYGKTPRVDITVNENEVMTRGEKDCYAEITFEVAGKKWKSAWKQERTRTGSLKPVNRLIADFEDKIIADQVRACDSEIVKIIGLTFEQFTKVIMLAQGSFAAFLQADKNQKGELLEQITGTEIYGTISKTVFERNRAEKEKLDKISIELESIKVLSDEEKANLINDIVLYEKDKTLIDEEIQKLTNTKNWLSDLKTLEEKINEANKKLPNLEQQAKVVIDTLEEVDKTLKAAKDEQKKLEPIFKKVRELDTKISEKDNSLKPIIEAISKLEQKINTSSDNLTKQESELKKSQQALKEKQQWLTSNKKYETLVTSYAAIEKDNQLLIDTSNEIKKINTDIAVLNKNLALKKLQAEKEVEVFNEKNNFLTVKNKELETKKTELANLLDGKNISDIQSYKEKLSNIEIQINNLIDVENTLSAIKNEIAVLNENMKKFTSLKKEITETIEIDKKTKDDLERKINLLDENIKLTKTIQSLEELRKNLEDGKECPLCGAIEHPYAKGNIPAMGEKEKELSMLKKQLQEIIKTIQQNEKDLATLIAKIESSQTNIVNEEKKLKDYFKKQEVIISDLRNLNSAFKDLTGENKIEKLNEILIRNKEELNKIIKLIEQATRYEKQIETLRDKEIPTLQKEKDIATKSKDEAETNLKVLEQEFKTKQETAQNLQEKYNNQNEQYLKKLESYNVKTIEALKKCLDSWIENKQIEERLSKDIITLENNIKLGKQDLENMIKQLEDKKNENQHIEAEKQKLLQERNIIFGEKSVEEEEKVLKEKLENLENRRLQAEMKKNEIYTELEKNKAIISEKKNEYESIKAKNITEKNIEEIETELVDKKKKSDEYSQKIGANKQALQDNQKNENAFEQILKEKEKQQAISSKWANLNNLIGSADGKKYRNFVQALTFEHLVGLSNKQLKKMSDRYLLKRTGDNLNPFELSVIDKYQNDEVRTAQNLSGGEKFIVSLSLALGLSSMASKNMRIDTMFIDEGFGTLDSDYLDVALNALSNLQSEGKIIGIISHLSELKERIATHIEVIPIGNGRSKIQMTT